MSPSPVTFSSPTAPSTYAWEATNEEVARRYGLRAGDVIRFDLNTSPSPPAMVTDVLAAGRFHTPLSEYPPSDYALLIAAAATRYGVTPAELLVGAGADEVLDLVAKAFIPPGGVAVIPTPTYAMYRILSEQRDAEIVEIPRRPATEGWAMDVPAVRRAGARARVIWLCSPNNPTGMPEPEGLIRGLLDGLAADAAGQGRPRPVVVLDEAYAEYVGVSQQGLRLGYPELIVVRTVSKAYGLAGLRVGFAVSAPETIARLAAFRPPGSVSTISVTVATEALGSDEIAQANVARVDEERPRLSAALRDAGLEVGSSRTNFVLVGLGSPERAAAVADGLLRRGLVPRTFGRGSPLASYLRFTVRDRADDDRLIGAIRDILGGASVGAADKEGRAAR